MGDTNITKLVLPFPALSNSYSGYANCSMTPYVVRLIRLSRASYRKMQENLVWTTGYNVIAIPLAAGMLAPIGILLSPAIGAAIMSASTIIVAINAQRLRGVSLTG